MTDAELFVLCVFLLIVLDAVTIAARVALLNTNLARLLSYREHALRDVDPTIRLVQNRQRLTASLNFARLLWRFLLAGIIWSYFSRQPGDMSGLAGAAGLIIGAFAVFWLEWLLGGHVITDAEAWSVTLTVYARAVQALTAPFVLLPLYLSGDRQPVPEGTGSLFVTEDDLKTLVDAGQQDGILEQGERKMIHSIFELGNTLAREIMVPRIDVLALDVSTPIPDAVDALLQSGYSRAPIYEESIDHVRGLLYAKDLLKVWHEGSQLDSLRELARPAYFIPEAKKVDELLTEMQRQRIHMAVVVDEYGGVAGLVTMEDIVEEILGEIQDEYDQGEESPFVALEDGEFIFQGRVDLDDFNEVTASHLPKDEADTLGGFLYSRLGHVPAAGEKVHFENLLLSVEQVTGRRIRKVRVHLFGPELEDSEEKIVDANK